MNELEENVSILEKELILEPILESVLKVYLSVKM